MYYCYLFMFIIIIIIVSISISPRGGHQEDDGEDRRGHQGGKYK